jgi:lysosomal acid lipase/cholesteryl ester hydrolase
MLLSSVYNQALIRNLRDMLLCYCYSWHEIGTRDIPAIIDYILEKTKLQKIFYMGHSQGTTVFYVMASELPAYNDKIHAMFSLAPIAYSSRMFSPVFQFLSQNIKHLQVCLLIL